MRFLLCVSLSVSLSHSFSSSTNGCRREHLIHSWRIHQAKWTEKANQMARITLPAARGGISLHPCFSFFSSMPFIIFSLSLSHTHSFSCSLSQLNKYPCWRVQRWLIFQRHFLCVTVCLWFFQQSVPITSVHATDLHKCNRGRESTRGEQESHK